MTDLKSSVEQLAKEQNKTEVQVITDLQAAAARLGEYDLLDQLCELKWDYISLPDAEDVLA